MTYVLVDFLIGGEYDEPNVSIGCVRLPARVIQLSRHIPDMSTPRLESPHQTVP
jgi:hypothetical protein